jgi:hypothetical protein
MLPARHTNKILPLIVAIISVGGYFLFIGDYGQSVYAFLEGHLLSLVSSILLCLGGPCGHHLPLVSRSTNLSRPKQFTIMSLLPRLAFSVLET